MEDKWVKRRRRMDRFLIFCGATILIVLLGNAFGRIEEAVVNNTLMVLGGAMTATIGSYVFGAAWEDINERKNQR